jgi:predicted nuclease of predicted toxin-antitoxin system
MRFLIDADLPRSAGNVFRRHGHEATDVRDVALGSAKDSEIARYAQSNDLCLVTGDFDFADIRNYPPDRYSGLLVLRLPRSATSAYINQVLDSFLRRTELVARLPGKLAIVEPGQIRFRTARPPAEPPRS